MSERTILRVILYIAAFYGVAFAIKNGDPSSAIVAAVSLAALAVTSKP